MPSSTECGPACLPIRTKRLIEVIMKMTADQVVSLVRRLAAPARTESRLRTLTTKSTGKIGALTLLQ